MKEYIIDRQPIQCGSYEAEKRRYKKTVDKRGRIWLYAIQDNPADNIYVCDNNPKSDGFAGRTLEFTLEDNTTISLKGPWHTNDEDLFRHTGIDLRDKHLTFVVIGLGRKTKRTKSGWVDVMLDIIYKDKKPILGKYKRGKEIAQRLANKLNKTVYCYSQGQGGSSNSPISPFEEQQ